MLHRFFKRRAQQLPDARAHEKLSAAQEFELKKQAIVEVAARTKAGLIAYPVLWILSMQGGTVFTDHRAYVLWNALGLGAVGLLRMAWGIGLRRRLDQHFVLARSVFRALMLLHGIYWSFLLAICVLSPEQFANRQFIIPISVALVITGSMMMSIDEMLGLSYPIAVFGVPVIALLLVSDPAASWYAVSASGLILYAWVMSRLFRNDYFRGERARFLLEDRARELEVLSLTDGLTQVRNRLYIEQQLPMLWREGQRQRQPLSVALVDLDHFKKINDTHGHVFGDECLKQAAHALREELLRPEDIVARYGGEEFLVLMPNTDKNGAQAVAERLRARVEARTMRLNGQGIKITCSVGVCSTQPDDMADGARQLMQKADEALYQAKAQGRNRVVAAAT